MAEQNPGVYNTVLSYIPGTAAYQNSIEDHAKRQDATEEESHKVHQGNTDTQGIGTTQGSDMTGHKNDSTFQGGNVGHGERSGHTGLGSYNQASRTGEQGTQTGSENIGGTGHSYGDQTGSAYNTGNTFGSSGHTHGPSGQTHAGHTHGSGGHNVGSETGSDTTYGSGRASDDAPSNFSSGTTNLGGQYGGTTGQKGGIEYEDDTGTHHSGYKPERRGQGTFNDQERNDGVRGAPIEGENVKGYAIGAPVGSGDTERPSQPGDPSGQVSGAHMEFGPKETDTRDSTGRGTLGQSQGTGDSSFANVKTSDGQGNSSHVVTRSSTSQMHSSSVTQL